MRKQFSVENPFRGTFRFDHAYVWQVVEGLVRKGSPISILDYGCNSGVLIRQICKSFPNVVATGLDKNVQALERGRVEGAGLPVTLICPDNLVGWVDANRGSYDVVLSMGVLEHVVDQARLISALSGAIKPGGCLLVSVPGRNIFSWADLGNWKFYFPRSHKWYITRKYGADFYRERFIDCVNGLFGDIEVGKDRHQHFRTSEIASLIRASGVKVLDVDGYGFAFRILHNVWWAAPLIVKKILVPAVLFDLRLGSSAELVVHAEK